MTEVSASRAASHSVRQTLSHNVMYDGITPVCVASAHAPTDARRPATGREGAGDSEAEHAQHSGRSLLPNTARSWTCAGSGYDGLTRTWHV
jgi:hypothetical protein